ncbi:sterile alpha motif domain-containing protein 9-like [Sinocyclocheilus grahami]|uniref:sterile alpha motif domain-containing protein 9-like n=1 Tax=Sinocyclocheilus grahami TaxID=75366 RepID=UPI0007AC5903|nr:PREDICTED: sterile alpha motif domain-containing protein 9-like [Sinocyclocheilus grahami]
MMYQLPSYNPSDKISIPATFQTSLSHLDIVWSDVSETVGSKINPGLAKQRQADFLKGVPPKWLNFYPANLPLVERDGFNGLIELIEKRKRKYCLITEVSLRYQSGSGGSTLAMQVLWRFRKDLRCAKVIDSDLDTKELSKQVLDLFLLPNEQHAEQDRRTVLLLLDTKEKINDLPIKKVLWEDLIEEIHKRGINTKTPAVIILNCIPTDFTLKDKLILPPNLSEGDKKQFKEQLLQQIRLQRKGHWKVTTISLLHHKDSGGSALASEVLRDLSEEFTCETLTEPFKTDIAENKDEFEEEIENMANKLLSIYKRPVLLLLDHEDDKPLRYLLKNLLSKLQHAYQADHPAFIIINAVSKSAVRVPGDVKLKMELLPDEKQRFAQKRQEIEQKYKKMSDKFHAFNIMQGGFQKEDAKNLITDEMRKHVENHIKSSSTRLLGFLALINSYVPGSRLTKPLCKEFIKQDRWTVEEKPSLEMIMKPFDDLMVIFSEGEQKANCIRLAHPLIADACLNMLTEHKLTRSDIAQDFLKNMVKGKESNYEKICKSLLVTRPEGLTEKDMFSRLILDIIRENNTNQCICLLESASKLFSTDPFYPQTLARLYYIKVQGENKYKKAKQWAKEAIDRDCTNSHIRDTLGQVHKNHLSRIWNKIKQERGKVMKPCTDIDTRLAMAKSAIDAFDDEEKAAKDELENPKTKYNNRGRFGFLQVCKEIYDLRTLIGPKNPLKQKHLDFNGLRGSVEDKYDFFEWYLAFSKLSFKEEDPDYFHRDVEDCYKRYFTQDTQNEEKTLNEKKKESFGGLLHFLKSDINVCKQNLSASEKPRSDNEDQIVLYILANIILSLSGEPCEKAEKLQARLQKLWFSKEQGRSPEFYLLIFLLFWPDDAQKAKTNPPDLENCVEYMSQSYESKYGEHLRGRYLVPLFFLGTEGGLQRLVHALKPNKKGLRRLVHSKLHQTDLELLTERDESVEVKCLQRINGKVKNHRVFAVRDEQQIPVSPHDRASVCKQGQVSFYLGFNIRGPVAYNIRYHKNCE